ncbi:hypothetical protein ACS15_5510 [Ralstonia insidiosa]|uniref:Uncharacterized protein n=1 Tax=Ralstonia insidiosa TaxID=190721 RepID=A0AAC9BLM6_9RALS|nr:MULTISPECIES: hypothetical protein [Ralstonia]ANH76681.1 hypothetical protein ACS15_5510 [Ralstonia insidiosa]EPX99568.1 hypothetical protein C404_03155 [Ralstonia sp. AU12-08]MBY4705097.1 hypothetical protein [Ralstonia insidiosa]GAQ29225.1 hypothetical protein SAMD00023378_2908 [Ralstonia sp. NT80]
MTLFQKFFVKGYRWLAVLILASVLLAAACYFGMVFIYGVNKSWGAPVIMSKSSPRIVSMTADVFRARQALDTLKLKLNSAAKARTALIKQKEWLIDLAARYEESLQVQKRVDQALTGKLGRLAGEKRSVDAKSAEVVKANRVLAESIDKNLNAGLITEEAAARARSQIVSAEILLNTGLIDTVSLESRMSELNYGIRTIDGAATSPKTLESLARLSVLKRELTEAELKLADLDAETAVNTAERKELETFLEKLTSSPYYLAAYGAQAVHQFAFVPYENEESVAVGAPVYSCFLEVLLCSKVGVVRAVTQDEEKGRHPVFQRDIRGFLVDLELTDEAAAKERVLFFGGRPLIL